MNFLKYILSHPQTLIAVVIIFGPILRGVLRKIKDQAAARQREIAKERAQIEALRTGGRIDEDQVQQASARAALERTAAKRRNEARAESEASVSRPMPSNIPGSSGPTVRPRPGYESRKARPIASPTANKPRAGEGTRQTSQRQPLTPQATPRREPSPITPPMAAPEPSMITSAVRQEEALAAANVATAVAAASRSRSEWRRAIVMQELLSPPVSMR